MRRGRVVVLTRKQLRDRAEQVARDLLQVSLSRAFKMLESGELRGTLVEAVLTPIYDMMKV